MEFISKQWLIEEHPQQGSLYGIKIKRQLHEETSKFQSIRIYDTEMFGHVMTLDGFVMVTQRDNFLYHEMMTHPVLYTHPNPRDVLIVGGGDCGTLKEVAKHRALSKITQVEIDQRVTELSEQYFPELCTANKDARVRLVFEDAIKWIANASPESLDIIIIDSTDPIGPGEGLFTAHFYKNCVRALRKDGILIHQSESPLYHVELTKAMRQAMKQAGFSQLRTFTFPMPTYPSGWWSATMASASAILTQYRKKQIAIDGLTFKYYSEAIHEATLALPPYLIKAFGEF